MLFWESKLIHKMRGKSKYRFYKLHKIYCPSIDSITAFVWSCYDLLNLSINWSEMAFFMINLRDRRRNIFLLEHSSNLCFII